eukprot:8997024-Pyramimonas_sp.AAC.1
MQNGLAAVESEDRRRERAKSAIPPRAARSSGCGCRPRPGARTPRPPLPPPPLPPSQHSVGGGSIAAGVRVELV